MQAHDIMADIMVDIMADIMVDTTTVITDIADIVDTTTIVTTTTVTTPAAIYGLAIHTLQSDSVTNLTFAKPIKGQSYDCPFIVYCYLTVIS